MSTAGPLKISALSFAGSGKILFNQAFISSLNASPNRSRKGMSLDLCCILGSSVYVTVQILPEFMDGVELVVFSSSISKKHYFKTILQFNQQKTPLFFTSRAQQQRNNFPPKIYSDLKDSLKAQLNVQVQISYTYQNFAYCFQDVIGITSIKITINQKNKNKYIVELHTNRNIARPKGLLQYVPCAELF
ncbi:Hypothetical_protein [Hexamita inflata]|uniref:Hypothetical_protein n=1 Tax=Hexamita inflata TaxID=28002 RepID=A0ABP1HGT2_9EUKA